MSETFYGDWSIVVTQKDAAFSERLVISGSDASDGAYPGLVGVGLANVQGERWTLALQWNDNAGSGWQQSGIRRKARYTQTEGFVVSLGADDNVASAQDFDFNDLVVELRYNEPRLNPQPPVQNSFDFTITKDMLKGKPPRDPKHHDPDCRDEPITPKMGMIDAKSAQSAENPE